MKRTLVKVVRVAAVILVRMDFDIVERMAEQQSCLESPEELLARLEEMREEGESEDNLKLYLQDYLK